MTKKPHSHVKTVGPKRVRVIVWNCEVGRNKREVLQAVREMVKAFNPHFIALQEARPYRDILDKELKGYTCISPKGNSGEAGDSLLFVRNASVFEKFQKVVLRMDTAWTGPKAGKFHHARIFVGAQSSGWLVISDHRTRPGWSQGGTAFIEEYNELHDVMSEAQAQGLRVSALGDQNIGTRPGDKKLKGSPFQLARALGGTVITRSAGKVDSAVTGHGVTGSCRELSAYGSDHPAYLFILEDTLR